MFTLPELPYSYDALEPAIDQETMKIHHDKHHAAYVNNLNDALKGNEHLSHLSIEEILKTLDQVPENIRMKVRNNGGGHYNHSLFWTVMTPGGSIEPKGELLKAINSTFGQFDSFKEQFTTKALGRFGSGWIWLVKKEDNTLEIVDTANQDNPISNEVTPILGLDVWEHAYYLKYKNVRAEYVSAWWSVVNWDEVMKLYAA